MIRDKELERAMKHDENAMSDYLDNIPKKKKSKKVVITITEE